MTSSADFCKEFCAFILITGHNLKRITAYAFAPFNGNRCKSQVHFVEIWEMLFWENLPWRGAPPHSLGYQRHQPSEGELWTCQNVAAFGAARLSRPSLVLHWAHVRPSSENSFLCTALCTVQVSAAHLKLEWRCSVRTDLQTLCLVALWDPLCQSFGMLALLFFTVFSAGETGLADCLALSGFLLRTAGMVIFWHAFTSTRPSSDWTTGTRKWSTQDQNRPSVNFEWQTLPLWLLVCVSRWDRMAPVFLQYFFWVKKLICLLRFWQEMNQAWRFLFIFSLSPSKHFKVLSISKVLVGYIEIIFSVWYCKLKLHKLIRFWK